MPLLDVRFPHPDFLSGYAFPDTFFPDPESALLAAADLAATILFLVAAWFFLFRKRSRTGLLAVTAASLLYLGFFRGGCPCPIGLIHGAAALAFRPDSVIGILSLLVFIIPIIAAFAKGRLYCSSVCPLGAVQEVLLLKPFRLPDGVLSALSVFPPLYLGAVLVFSYTDGPSVVCLADPFVALFHLGGPWYRYLLLAAFAAISVFVYRPYCRFFCPYGLLLKGAACFSGSVPDITKGTCIDCGLCDAHCPAQAVRGPEDPGTVTKKDRRRLLILLALFPFVAGLTTYGGTLLGSAMAAVHPDVYLGRVVADLQRNGGFTAGDPGAVSDDPVLEALLGRTDDRETAVERSREIERTFRLWMGASGFIASLFFLFRVTRAIRRRRRIRREPIPGECFSCGRCIAGCPVERAGIRAGEGEPEPEKESIAGSVER